MLSLTAERLSDHTGTGASNRCTSRRDRPTVVQNTDLSAVQEVIYQSIIGILVSVQRHDHHSSCHNALNETRVIQLHAAAAAQAKGGVSASYLLAEASVDPQAHETERPWGKLPVSEVHRNQRRGW